ncbi:MAG: 30S ribosomal protein S16 [Armatimonadetes bacterium]|nr:30S ribosomal protein S16 [Armatimonadota bacterium]
MSVRIRLRRMGAKKRPFYRVVVADQRAARNGRFIDTLGYYDPCAETPQLHLDEAKVAHWLRCGAQPSDTTKVLLKKSGLLETASDPLQPR